MGGGGGRRLGHLVGRDAGGGLQQPLPEGWAVTLALEALVKAASQELGSQACANGNHSWVTIGCRGCPHPEDIGADACGQAVYECRVCGDTDYGEPGGPGHRDCMECRFKTYASDISWWSER